MINLTLLEGKIWSFVLGISFSSLRPEKWPKNKKIGK